MKCWCTMPMPGVDGVVGAAEATASPVDGDGALVGALHPVEDLHQRRLAGAVLADDRVDGRRRRTAQVDVAVGDDAGEALDDVPVSSTAEIAGAPVPSRSATVSGGHAASVTATSDGSDGLRVQRRTPAAIRVSVGTLISPSMICCFSSSSCSGVRDLAAGGGEVDAAVLQVADVHAALELAVDERARSASYTATSTRLSHRREHALLLGRVATWKYWSVSTPMTRRSAAAAALKTPVPERPAAW